MPETRCGYVAIVGRPNVGKSTLLNRILGQKISITSRKPQTTRHRLLGIKTGADVQTLYVDTPGLHRDRGKAINRYMNRAARSLLTDVDVVVLLLDRVALDADDEVAIEAVASSPARKIIAINKVDILKNKGKLLPTMAFLGEKFTGCEVVPVSAANGHNVKVLEALIEKELPAGPFCYPEEQITDRSERFLVAEIIREKMMRQLGDELPYAVTMQIEGFRESSGIVHVDALALVERQGQKAILIGRKGERLKQISVDARKDIEKLLGRGVMLRIWVKVKSGWSDDERALRSLGYEDV